MIDLTAPAADIAAALADKSVSFPARVILSAVRILHDGDQAVTTVSLSAYLGDLDECIPAALTELAGRDLIVLTGDDKPKEVNE